MQSRSQYYLRGVVKDENGRAIYNAKIYLHSKGTVPFYTGISGAFGIPISKITDTIMLDADGYETFKSFADSRKYQEFTLKSTSANSSVFKHKLSSLIPENTDQSQYNYYHSGESYSALIENNFADAGKDPETGFALNINRASYSNIRRFLNINMPVPPDAVRIEEMLNYFDLTSSGEKDTGKNAFFKCSTQLTQAPWDLNNRLLFIKLKAPFINADSVPPANLVFLIDVSGSMDMPNRLPLLKEAFKMLVNNLRQQDTVAIVIYGGIVGTYLQPTPGNYKDSIKNAIEKLEPGGETPGEAAIRTAYALAERMFNKNSNNRIILATDGDFNVGQTSDKELEDLVVSHRQSGIYLTCLGVGVGNYKDSKLETLAKKGNGNFAYIDNINEAEKVLVTEFTKTMYSVANDAYMHVYFNPYYVKSYRLMGYDNKKEVIDDGITELEGGEVGSGHNFMAVFEIEPSGIFNDSLMRNEPDLNIAQLKLHYKLPENGEEVSLLFPVQNNFLKFTETDSSLRFATSVAMFGGLLKQSDLWNNYNWDDILKIARPSINNRDYAQKEFLALIEKAKNIYEPYNKKKKKKRADDE